MDDELDQLLFHSQSPLLFTKFFAIPWQGGGGPVYVSRLENLGKVEPNPHLLYGHKSPVLDLAFYPFDDTVLATGGDDAGIKVISTLIYRSSLALHTIYTLLL